MSVSDCLEDFDSYCIYQYKPCKNKKPRKNQKVITVKKVPNLAIIPELLKDKRSTFFQVLKTRECFRSRKNKTKYGSKNHQVEFRDMVAKTIKWSFEIGSEVPVSLSNHTDKYNFIIRISNHTVPEMFYFSLIVHHLPTAHIHKAFRICSPFIHRSVFSPFNLSSGTPVKVSIFYS